MIEKETIPYHRPITMRERDLHELQRKIEQIIRSGNLTNGEYVKALEDKIKRFYGVDYVIATSNCTMGLMICIEFLEKARYLQVPMFNWWSVLYVLNFLKKGIAWIDVDMNAWLPIEEYLGDSLYLNTFGNIGKSKRNNTIYDSSHCLGAKIEHIGLAHVFSLAPTKLVTSCEGGLIITNNKELYDFAKEYRDKICRMSEVHAVIGLATLEYLDYILQWKETVYHYYKYNLLGLFQEIPNNSNYNTIGFLNIEGLKIPKHITTKQYYEPIRESVFPNSKKSNAENIYEKIVCLPSYYDCPYKQIVEDILELNGL